MKANKAIAWLTGLLTLSLAAFSFILSFNALTDLAARHGVSIPPLFPLVVEFAVVIFSLNALYRSLNGEDTRLQWALIIGSSPLAGAFNVAHAQSDALSRAMAAMPSLFLLLSFESFLSLVNHGVRRSSVIQSIVNLTAELDAKNQELDNRQQKLDNLSVKIEQAHLTLQQLKQEAKGVKYNSILQAQAVKFDNDKASIDNRRNEIVYILQAEGDIGVSKLAERLNASRQTIYNDLDTLCQDGIVNKNGNGWEVVST